MKALRNTLAVILGIAVYAIAEYIAIFVIGFALTIPILSQLMTCFIIPEDLFLAATVPCIAFALASSAIGALSDHKDINYSGVIAFTLMFIFTVFNFVKLTTVNGFIWMQLISTIIKCGFFVIGITTSADGQI